MKRETQIWLSKRFKAGRRTVQTDVEVRCQFCPGTWWASAEDGCVIHTQPICEKFRRLEPDEFVKANRIEMESN